MSGSSTNPHQQNRGDVVIGDRAKQYKASSSTNEGNGVYIGTFSGAGYDNFRSSGNSRDHVSIGAFAMANGGGSAREGQVAIGAYASIGDQTTETQTYNTSTFGIAVGYQAEGTGGVYKDITRSGVGKHSNRLSSRRNYWWCNTGRYNSYWIKCYGTRSKLYCYWNKLRRIIRNRSR